ncbi:MAG: alpha/beta fold hydrolase [Desulfosarcina sp.]|nr:alpha/beta fold hydrolase [Desulfobacterales bacterium]
MSLFKSDDGVPIFYKVFDKAPPGRPTILFLNGTAQTTLNWRPYARRLKALARVVLYDARCQGRSGGSQVPTLDRHALDLGLLLDHLTIHKAGLVGLSHGARVALAAARLQ